MSVDDRGRVAVLDSVTNGLYLYDATKRYRLFRTLGHRPRGRPAVTGLPPVGH